MVGKSRARSVLALGGTAGICLACAAVVGACGSRSTLYAFGGPGGSYTGPVYDASLDDAGPDAPDDAPGVCMGRPIDVTLNAPNLYFILDHSASMAEMNKWANIRQVVSQLLTQIGAGARFGAAMFPGADVANSCQTGAEVMSLRQGDAHGAVADAFLNATAAAPAGGTPTAATLQVLTPKLSSLPGTTFAILATDGGPNCNASLTCPRDECTANIDGVAGCPMDFSVLCCAPPQGNPRSCLDADDTVAAASALEAAGVETFVLGIPGSDAYGNVLDEIAIAGGTARTTEPLYYQVTSADDAALASAFGQIVQQTGAGCTFTLESPPATPVGLRAVLGGVTLPSTGPNRWSLQGQTLTLFGTSCDGVKSDGAPSLQFFDGCRG